MLFLDLDHFKHINDSLGHPIGDTLLQSVARRLVSCVRDSDTVSRQGGDEFIVLLSEVAQAKNAAPCAQKLLTMLKAPNFIGHHGLEVSASIGISIYPEDGLDPETLIKTADTAMYQAKEHGRNNYKFFEAGDEHPRRRAAVHRRGFARRPGTAGVRSAVSAEDRSAERERLPAPKR